jgi:hypothetical protein
MKKWELERLLSREMLDDEKIELDQDAVLYLAKIIVRSRDTGSVAKSVLAASRDRGHFRPLCEAFVLAAAISQEPAIRMAAADAARNLSSDAKDKVLAVLKDDPDPGVQRTAAISAQAKLQL